MHLTKNDKSTHMPFASGVCFVIFAMVLVLDDFNSLIDLFSLYRSNTTAKAREQKPTCSTAACAALM